MPETPAVVITGPSLTTPAPITLTLVSGLDASRVPGDEVPACAVDATIRDAWTSRRAEFCIATNAGVSVSPPESYEMDERQQPVATLVELLLRRANAEERARGC